MSHKVHPKAFRIRQLKDWSSRWLNIKKMPQYLEEDFLIRQFIKKKLKKMAIEKVEIERSPNKILVIISTARPGLIIGRAGQGISILRKHLLSEILKKTRPDKDIKSKTDLKVEVREIRNPWISAPLVSQWMAEQIEKRVPYRRVLKGALSRVMRNREVKGARVQVAGRLNGVEIARTEWLKQGKMPRHTIRADIDFIRTEAHCTYGIIGIKVWIYKGERFD